MSKVFNIFASNLNVLLEMAKIKVQDTEISIVSFKEKDNIYLTDMANAKKAKAVQLTSLRIGYAIVTL